jgi:ribosomal protein S27E
VTEVKCDGCGRKQINYDFVKVTMRDGEHPHNGSTMYQKVDVCPDCLRKLDLRSDTEVGAFKLT